MKSAWINGTFFIAVLAALTFTSCKDKNKSTYVEADPFKGGKGGSSSISVKSNHDGFDIDSCTVYIKYDALDKPATYDDSLKCTYFDAKPPVVTFTNLRTGHYYMYVKGWDINLSRIVTGTFRFTINKPETAYDVVIPVYL